MASYLEATLKEFEMPIYLVKHYTMEERTVTVDAPDWETAKGADSYGLAIEGHAEDSYWHDADIIRQWDDIEIG